MTKLERKANEVITLYKEKYMEDLQKDFSIKDNDTKNLNLVIKNTAGSQVRFVLSDFPKDMSTEEIVDYIYEKAQDEKENLEILENSMKDLLDFQNVKNRLFVRLLNTERNQERLTDIVTKSWHNLSMVLCISIEIPGRNENGMIQVRKQLIKSWHKTVDELFDVALKNADKNFPVKPVNIIDKILSMQYPFLSDDIRMQMKNDMLKEQEFCLYICKNETALSAAGFLYPSVISTLQPGDYIIPSSTEECLIAKCDDFETEELLKAVSEVNQTESVTDDIFLSDNVYEYVGNGEFIMH